MLGSRRIFGLFLEIALLGQVALLRFGQRRFDKLRGEVRRRREQHQAGDAAALAGLAQFLHQAQRDPGAHGRADEHLRPVGEAAEDCEAFAQPFRDGAVGKDAAGLAMAGIVVAQEGAAFGLRPAGKGFGLGAQHVRAVAAEPDDARLVARNTAIGDRRSVDIKERRLRPCFNPCCGQGFWHRRDGAESIAAEPFVQRCRQALESGDLFSALCY